MPTSSASSLRGRQSDRGSSVRSNSKPEGSESTSTEWLHYTRSQRLMSQMLSTIIPNSAEDISRKYPALLDVPFISISEILLTREIGSGSFGRVFHGIFSFQDVAVKKLTVRNFRDEIDIYEQLAQEDGSEGDKKAKQAAETLLALEKEVAMLKRITFPKVVGFYGVCFEPPAIVSEYCARGSLFDLIARARVYPRVAKELSWARRLRLANDAAIGMSFLHNRMDPIIHRDLKSPNLLVDQHYNCKVADFNTAGFVNATEITKSQANNPRWLAPEIADGKTHDRASDVYPFGIILWELLTWMRPFEMDGFEMTTYNILLGIVRNKLRPTILPNDELIGGPCPVYDEYVELMTECWDQNPAGRPGFRQIHKRLETMIKTADEKKAQEPSSPPARTASRPRGSTRPREYSPEPNLSRSPREESPFSRPFADKSPVPSPRSRTNGEQPATVVIPPVVQVGSDVEECLTSPFQNGPPSGSVVALTGDSAGRTQDKTLNNPPSFANWSVRAEQPTTEAASGLFEYSDVVQQRPPQVKTPAQERWHKIRAGFGLDALIMSKTKKRPGALERWDSVRTAIFGDPTSSEFEEQFGSFLKGDETAELKKRLNEISARGSPGLRILRALMELREEQEKAENAKGAGPPEREAGEGKDKTSGWGVVKHLMMINLPAVVHPMWEVLAESIRPRYSVESSLRSIEEDTVQSHRSVADVTSQEDPARQRAKELWKFVRDMFLDPDYQKPVLHPLWLKVRDFFFSDGEEEEEAEAETIASPTPPAVEPPPSNSLPVRRQRKPSRWDTVRQTLLGGVVESNWDFLTTFARTEIIKKRSEASALPAHIRKISIVDDEPPSAEKWMVVKSLLTEEKLGENWAPLQEKARRNVDPPRGTEWEIFRWLFFENKDLRTESRWMFIKDLLVKTASDEDQAYLM